MYENSTLLNRRDTYNTRIEVEEQIYRGELHKPKKSNVRNDKKRTLVDEIPPKKQFQRPITTNNLSDNKKGSLVNKTPEYNGKRYKPGAGEEIVCDYAHNTRCNGTCLSWKDQFLKGQLFSIEKKIRFPSFDDDFGNFNVNWTNFENLFKINLSMALSKKASVGPKIALLFNDKPEKLLPDGSNRKLSGPEQRSLTTMLVN
jgi:hypothetical protein